jgi:signal recognition particle receptor subunit beta
MLDASDPDRIEEASTELRSLLHMLEGSSVPLAIFANKSELESALPLGALQTQLGLEGIKYPHVQLFSISVVQGTGYVEGFRWLAKFV